MMPPKNEEGFLQGGLDPAVQAALGGGQKRAMERKLPKRERAKLKKSQERQEARKGARAVYDLKPGLIEEVKKLAEKHGTTASQVAGIAIWIFLMAVERGEVDMREFKVRLHNNPRYEYILAVPANKITGLRRYHITSSEGTDDHKPGTE